MLSRRLAWLLPLLILMELLPAFVVLVGSSLLDATSWNYGLFWVLAVVALIGASLGPILQRVSWGARTRKGATLGLATVTAAIFSLVGASGVVAFVVTFVMLEIAFWRGRVLTLEPISHGDVQQRFAYGFGILFVGILWVIARGIVADRAIWQMLAAAGIGFIVVSMLALVLARVDVRRERGASGAVALAVAIQIGVVLVLSILALQIFAVDLAGALGHAMQPVFDGIGRGLYAFLGYIADPIDRFMALIRPHGHSSASSSAPLQPGGEYYGKRPKYHKPVRSPLVAIVSLVLIAGLACAIGYGIWRSIPKSRRVREHALAYREQRRSTLSAVDVWRRFLTWLRRIRSRGEIAAASVVRSASGMVGRPLHPDDPVRGLYVRLLRRARAQGTPMQAWVTPAEFQVHLMERWPGGADDFEAVTAAYMRRRYGDESIALDELAGLRSAWGRLRGLMKGPSPLAVALAHRQAEMAEAVAQARGRPSRPFPKQTPVSQVLEGEREPWKPTGLVLVALSFALPVFVILGFLLILAVAAGRIG